MLVVVRGNELKLKLSIFEIILKSVKVYRWAMNKESIYYFLGTSVIPNDGKFYNFHSEFNSYPPTDSTSGVWYNDFSNTDVWIYQYSIFTNNSRLPWHLQRD
jgi:hypothetical protein